MQIGHLLLSVFLLFLVSDLHADVGDDVQEVSDAVKTGIDAANVITDIVSGVKILSKFTKIMRAVAPYLAAIGPLMNLITLFLPKQEVPTLTFLKEQFSRVDSNFRNMERLFGEVTNLIKSKGIKSQFSAIEQNVNALSYRLRMLMKAPKEAIKGQKSRFISSFKASYQNAAKKIYDGIMKNQSFTDNIPKEAMQYTNHDRKKMQKVMARCFGLLVTAVKVNLAFLKLINRKASYKMEKNYWEKGIKEVLEKVKSVDAEVTDAWKDQRFRDLKDLSAQYKDDGNKEFADRLYEFYSEKYYWRDWVVIVYNKMAKSWTGKNGHDFRLCGGDDYLDMDGRNVLTSSVAKDKRKINTTYYKKKLSEVKTETVALIHYAWSAKGVLKQMAKFSGGSDVCMRAVISDREAAQSKSVSGRLDSKWKYFYNMYIFG
ncbi:uncharacterized protein LOC125655306 [Ostrea edulis]|uniref:uncharacterized protein LOC125655306 n=1 Tax=Ostrea edulis TaxID=37623 RepID=UPI0020941C13|nr:uncharacterized protein LOC125655306 [Ostrea edulis]XP_055999900.1 uncharacterized protein LOC125655306 [Ostrea edulis]